MTFELELQGHVGPAAVAELNAAAVSGSPSAGAASLALAKAVDGRVQLSAQSPPASPLKAGGGQQAIAAAAAATRS